MHTKINWFEIPSTGFGRAIRFYETLFDTTLRLKKPDSDSLEMALFSDPGGIPRGCVTHDESHSPSSNGTLLYLDDSPSIDAVLARLVSAGGEIRMPNMELPNDIGYIAHFIDTEGNLLALHSQHSTWGLRMTIRQRIAGR